MGYVYASWKETVFHAEGTPIKSVFDGWRPKRKNLKGHSLIGGDACEHGIYEGRGTGHRRERKDSDTEVRLNLLERHLLTVCPDLGCDKSIVNGTHRQGKPCKAAI